MMRSVERRVMYQVYGRSNSHINRKHYVDASADFEV